MRKTLDTALIALAIGSLAAMSAATADVSGPERAMAVAIEQLPKSSGYYRIPYEDGTNVKVTRDHNTHTPKGRYDMVGTGGEKPYKIVAAASGTIVAIEDSFSAQQDSDTAP